MVHAACWAHARRKFFQAVELNPQDQTAIGIVAQIDELFKIEREVPQAALSREDTSGHTVGEVQAAARTDQVPDRESTLGRIA